MALITNIVRIQKDTSTLRWQSSTCDILKIGNKKGKPGDIQIRELLAIRRHNDEEDAIKLNKGKEWGYEFKV